ncbi:MAG: rane protein [Alphaproteobacteria bacterium]|nr:rane protein [Alphaproteobacteria bacterium]
MASPAPRPEAEQGRDYPRSTARIFGHPIHPKLVPFPIVCFTGALLTDIAYTQSANLQWANFSIWLITAGLVMGGAAAVTGLIDYFGDRRVRQARPATPHMLINILVYVLELFNAFVHSRDGWTSVVPTGLTLSIVSVVLLAVSAWLGGSLVFRYGVGQSR